MITTYACLAAALILALVRTAVAAAHRRALHEEIRRQTAPARTTAVWSALTLLNSGEDHAVISRVTGLPRDAVKLAAHARRPAEPAGMGQKMPRTNRPRRPAAMSQSRDATTLYAALARGTRIAPLAREL